jgi:hypothetical protein
LPANAGITDARPVAAVTNERRVSEWVVRVLPSAGGMAAILPLNAERRTPNAALRPQVDGRGPKPVQ